MLENLYPMAVLREFPCAAIKESIPLAAFTTVYQRVY
jgi:hypothetical protein